MFGERLKQLRKDNKITQGELAARLGITQQAVGKWETGKSSPDPETLLSLSKMFDVSVDNLLGQSDIGQAYPGQGSAKLGTMMPYSAVGQVMVPVLGTVRAGYGALAFEEDYGEEPANVRDPENYFYLLVKGDSMEPRIQDGDLALVRKQQTLDDGDLGVIVYGDQSEGTLKRFLRKGNAVILQPFNPDYDTVILAGEELESLYIAGKVVETKAKWT